MIVLSAVISVLLIAAVSVACWWLAHSEEYAEDLDLPHRVCARCLLDGIDRPVVEDLSERITRCGRRACATLGEAEEQAWTEARPAPVEAPVEAAPVEAEARPAVDPVRACPAVDPVRGEIPAAWSSHPAP
ncbi:hypothetical protein NDR87_29420 [Nocardia sp. CDC159]|uniref:Uncharacterized protein n=1 Tax=Nocardia pulmonis TaxID=2951408 RepID=A0A9X2EC90_9NOCA|nr:MULTISPECIES: hypothetical protein [Nocardia]MCM6777696.1 hypothetical protein [Nocardia pulmonis]MCM6790500.1 hypothetical protein [Nocardia sp. CDC159]